MFELDPDPHGPAGGRAQRPALGLGGVPRGRGVGRGGRGRGGGLAVGVVGPDLDDGPLAAALGLVGRGHHLGHAGQARRARDDQRRPPRHRVRGDPGVGDPALDLHDHLGRRDDHARRAPVAEPVLDQPAPLVLGDRPADDRQRGGGHRGGAGAGSAGLDGPRGGRHEAQGQGGRQGDPDRGADRRSAIENVSSSTCAPSLGRARRPPPRRGDGTMGSASRSSGGRLPEASARVAELEPWAERLPRRRGGTVHRRAGVRSPGALGNETLPISSIVHGSRLRQNRLQPGGSGCVCREVRGSVDPSAGPSGGEVALLGDGILPRSASVDRSDFAVFRRGGDRPVPINRRRRGRRGCPAGRPRSGRGSGGGSGR